MNIKNIFAKIKLKYLSGTTKGSGYPKPKMDLGKIQNDKNKYIFVLRMFSILIIALLAGLIFATILFVYQTIMNTIGQVQSISLYQSELQIELIDFNRLDKIEKKWEEKISDEKLDLKRNPFVKKVSTTTTPNNISTP